MHVLCSASGWTRVLLGICHDRIALGDTACQHPSDAGRGAIQGERARKHAAQWHTDRKSQRRLCQAPRRPGLQVQKADVPRNRTHIRWRGNCRFLPIRPPAMVQLTSAPACGSAQARKLTAFISGKSVDSAASLPEIPDPQTSLSPSPRPTRPWSSIKALEAEKSLPCKRVSRHSRSSVHADSVFEFSPPRENLPDKCHRKPTEPHRPPGIATTILRQEVRSGCSCRCSISFGFP